MNKVMLIGHVGKDPEVHYYDADQCVASFPLATTERGYTLANGTKVPDHTAWHNIVLFKSLGKYAEKYIHNGATLLVEGRVRYRSYDDKNGVRRQSTEIYAASLEWLADPKKAESSNVESGETLSTMDEMENSKLPF